MGKKVSCPREEDAKVDAKVGPHDITKDMDQPPQKRRKTYEKFH